MLTVVLLLLIGMGVARWRLLPDGAVSVIDALIIRVALPGVIVARIPSLVLDVETVGPVAVAWGQLLVVAAIVLAIGRAAGWDRRVLGTLLLVVPLGNTSFLGIPATEALLGADHVPYAVVYDQLGSFLALATYGTVIAATYGDGGAFDARATVRRVLTFPPFVALVAAFFLRLVPIPMVVEDVATSAGAMLTPLAMLSVGMRLRIRASDVSVPLAFGLGLRLVVAPALVLLALRVGGLDTSAPVWATSTLESAMPPMVTAGVVASASGLDERLAAGLVGLGVLIAAVSLPIWAAVLV